MIKRDGISRGDRENRGVRGLAVEIGRIGRWAGKNRIDCLNRSGKSRTDCRIVRFESRVVHAEASPTPDTPDLPEEFDREFDRLDRPNTITRSVPRDADGCNSIMSSYVFYHETRKNRFRRTQKEVVKRRRPHASTTIPPLRAPSMAETGESQFFASVSTGVPSAVAQKRDPPNAAKR